VRGGLGLLFVLPLRQLDEQMLTKGVRDGAYGDDKGRAAEPGLCANIWHGQKQTAAKGVGAQVSRIIFFMSSVCFTTNQVRSGILYFMLFLLSRRVNFWFLLFCFSWLFVLLDWFFVASAVY